VIDGRFLTHDVTGVERVAIEVVTALDRALTRGEHPGLDVELLVPRRAELATRMDLDSIRLRAIGRLRGHLWEQLELPRHVGSSPLLCLSNVAPVRSLYGRSPVFTVVHDLSYRYFPEAYGRAFRLFYGAVVPAVLRRSRLVFTVSESEQAAMTAVYPRVRDRIVVAPNGGPDVLPGAVPSADAASLAAGAGDVPSRAIRDRTCLYVGSLTKRKNAEGLLALASRLTADGRTRFVFVGGSSKAFEAVAVDDGLRRDERVRFVGQVNDVDRLEEEYRRSMVFVFPSLYESSGMPPTEAMRNGCPVVVSDLPALRERCADAALYCDPRDPSSMEAQVRRLLDDDTLWAEHQLRGLERAARFSWDEQSRIIVDSLLAALGTEQR
jgi:glycosyltransferase involved in cell wall biosynthesis